LRQSKSVSVEAQAAQASQSAWELRRHKPVSQRGSARGTSQSVSVGAQETQASQSAWEPKRHKPVSQRGSARELEELRTELKETAKENSEDRWTSQVASSRRRYARVLVVAVSVTVKEPFNKPASFKPQPH
jgi:hypothetical protein